VDTLLEEIVDRSGKLRHPSAVTLIDVLPARKLAKPYGVLM
jgi:hypothetical protein